MQASALLTTDIVAGLIVNTLKTELGLAKNYVFVHESDGATSMRKAPFFTCSGESVIDIIISTNGCKRSHVLSRLKPLYLHNLSVSGQISLLASLLVFYTF